MHEKVMNMVHKINKTIVSSDSVFPADSHIIRCLSNESHPAGRFKLHRVEEELVAVVPVVCSSTSHTNLL